MPRSVRLLLTIFVAVLILAALGAWAYRTFVLNPVELTYLSQLQTKEVAGITFEVEYEQVIGAILFTTGGPDSIRFTRRDDVLDFHSGLVTVNEIGMPDVKTGDVVRWNLTGPLLVNGQPVEPHALQARPIEAPSTDKKWTPLPSLYPRDTLSVAWAGKTRLLVAAHGDGAVRVWDVDKGEVLKTMVPDPPKEARGNFGLRAAVSPDGKTIAAANLHGEEVTLWDVATGNKTGTFTEPKGKVNAVAFESNNSLIEARGANLYSRRLGSDGKRTIELGKVHDQFPSSIAVNTLIAWNDGAKVHTAHLDYSMLIVGSGVPSMATIQPITSTGCIALSFDGSLLAVFDGDSRLSIYDSKTGKVQRRLRWRGKLGSANSINALAFSPDGKTLAVGDNDSIRLYDVPTGRERGGLSCPWVRSLAYSADGRTLAAGLRFQPGVRLWDTADLVAK